MNIDISQSESDEIFSDILFDFVEIKRPSASKNPKGIILGGQPGSGKSYLKDEVILEFNESFIFVSTDDLRLYHPAYLELQQNPETVQNAANLVNLYASAWTERLIKYCIENKYNLIIDSILGGNIQAVYDTIDMFRNNDYQVHLRVMAVPATISKMSIFLRYETQLAEKGFARWTRMEDHDDRFEALEENLTHILINSTPESMAFYKREFDENGTIRLSQFEYINCKNVTKKFELLEYKNWLLFERYREQPLIEETLYLINTLNTIVKLIQNRNGSLEDFNSYLREELLFFNISPFDEHRVLLNSFILKILDDNCKANDSSTNDDDIEIIIKQPNNLTQKNNNQKMQKIKVGVVGTGFIGPAHIEALRRLPNIEVTALCEVNIELATAKAAQLGIERPCTFEQLLDMEDIVCVHICTPNFLHYSQSKAALLAGKHVVCEKPLAKDLHEAEELVAIAKETGLVNAVHFNLRYYPLIRQMKTMREKGDLGDVYSIIGSYLQDWLFYETDYNWRLEPDKSGDSRAIADIGSHLMDVIEYITGLKTTEVMADFNTIHKTRKKPLKPIATYSGEVFGPEDYADVPINTEDTANVLLRFDNGNKGLVTVSQVSAGRKNQLKLEISGSNKTFAFNSEAPNELWIGNRDSYNQSLMRDPSLAYPEASALMSFPGGHNEGFPDTSKQLFKEVYAAIAEGKMPENAPFPTFADGYRELLICERILESHRSQGWVKV